MASLLKLEKSFTLQVLMFLRSISLAVVKVKMIVLLYEKDPSELKDEEREKFRYMLGDLRSEEDAWFTRPYDDKKIKLIWSKFQIFQIKSLPFSLLDIFILF